MWCLSSYHYGDKELEHGQYINTASCRFSDIIIFMCEVQRGMALRVDLLLEIIITKVVITMVTKRPCIPIAQINGFSGMM